MQCRVQSLNNEFDAGSAGEGGCRSEDGEGGLSSSFSPPDSGSDTVRGGGHVKGGVLTSSRNGSVRLVSSPAHPLIVPAHLHFRADERASGV